MFRIRYLLLLTLFFTFSQVIQANPHYRDGRIAYSRKNYESAMKHFEAAVQSEPGNGNPWFFIGSIQEYQGRRDSATESYRKGVDLKMDKDLREKALWKIMLYYRYTGNWDGLAVYAQKFLSRRDSADVRKLLDEAESKRDPRTAEMQRLMNNGLQDFDKKDYESAEKRFAQVLDMDSDYEPALWKMSITLMEMNRYKSAAKYLNRLIKEDRETWEYHYKLAVCRYHTRQYEASLKSSAEARRLNDDKGSRFRRFTETAESLSLTELERFSEAEKGLGSLEKRSALQNGILARAKLGLNKDEEAVRLAEAALKEDPVQKDALYVNMVISVRGRNLRNTVLSAKPLHTQILNDYSSEKLPPASLVKGLTEAADFIYRSGDYDFSAAVYRNTEMWQELSQKQRMNYSNALLLSDQTGPAAAEARKLKDSGEMHYQLARIAAKSGDTESVYKYLESSAAADPSLIRTVRADRQLTGWMAADTGYSDFLTKLENKYKKSETVSE